jgi:hypothetical protein
MTEERLSPKMREAFDRIEAAQGAWVTGIDFRTGTALVRRGLVVTAIIDREAWTRGWRLADYLLAYGRKT